MQHNVFGVQHVLPADILVVPNVFRWSYRCHGLNREGITCLREGESVVADGPVGVSGGFPASSRSEVVEFYVFQVVMEKFSSEPWSEPKPIRTERSRTPI